MQNQMHQTRSIEILESALYIEFHVQLEKQFT